MKEEIKTFSEKQKLREFVTNRPFLQEILKGISLPGWNKRTLGSNSKACEEITSKGSYIDIYKANHNVIAVFNSSSYQYDLKYKFINQ